MAPVVADSLNIALSIRRFDDTLEEGTGFLLRVEPSMTNMNILMTWRPQTPPTIARMVAHRLYSREIPVGASIPAWAFRKLANMTIVASTIFWQQDTHTIPLNASGPTILASRLYQFELTRVSTATGLSGDWDLLELHIETT